MSNASDDRDRVRRAYTCTVVAWLPAGIAALVAIGVAAGVLLVTGVSAIAAGVAVAVVALCAVSVGLRLGSVSYQTVYREISRNRKPDGSYQPWYAHNQAHQRRQRPRSHRLAADHNLRRIVEDKLQRRWSPRQVSRWLPTMAASHGLAPVCGDDL